MTDPKSSGTPSGDRGRYVVVARRYRPQGFEDLVGQGMVAQALSNAILTDRVGHAYLFTGARGVGKTSTARILSKALNCEQGPTPTPCHKCDICETIASGDDVDVLEIDGASNRGIDEIRQLRSNVSVRPSRSRYKIYIIDEVHMLTREAFNALLKTLEEPPEHVKFIFCTTDPEKIPITVLSRCQRFDFSPVEPQAIVERLKFIVQSEGAEADDEALKLLARRAAGSMRDSQSLLEQLLSFTSERITEEAVHRMLGTAGNESLLGVVEALSQRDAAQALRGLDSAIREGVDAGQLAEQLLGCLRDLLAVSVGGGEELLLHSSAADMESLSKIANSWGTSNLLAAAQILDQAVMRMRMVMHSRILLETSLVRIAQLENLQELANLVAQVQAGAEPAPAKKKTAPKTDSVKPELPTDAAADSQPSMPNAANAQMAGSETPTPSTEPAPTTTLPPAGSADSMVATSESTADEHSRVEVLSATTVASVGTGTDGQAGPAPAEHAADEDTNESSAANDSAADSDEPAMASTTPASDAAEASNPGSEDMSGTAIWRAAIEKLDGMSADFASHFVSAANSAPNRLVVTFPSMYTSSKSFCQRPKQHSAMERMVSEVAGKKLKLEFALRQDGPHKTPAAPAMSARQRERLVTQLPFVQRAVELFSASVTGVSSPKRSGE